MTVSLDLFFGQSLLLSAADSGEPAFLSSDTLWGFLNLQGALLKSNPAPKFSPRVGESRGEFRDWPHFSCPARQKSRFCHGPWYRIRTRKVPFGSQGFDVHATPGHRRQFEMSWTEDLGLSGGPHTGLSPRRPDFVSHLKPSATSHLLILTTWVFCLNLTKPHQCSVPNSNKVMQTLCVKPLLVS